MITKINKNEERKIRARRQNDIKGTAKKPRLVVYRSLSHIYAQLVDDDHGKTLIAVNTLQPEIEKLVKGKTKKEEAEIVGEQIWYSNGKRNQRRNNRDTLVGRRRNENHAKGIAL